MEINVGQGLLNAALFLGIPGIILIFYAMWRWHYIADRNVLLEIIPQSGSKAIYEKVPRDGGEVTLHNPKLGVTRTWPVHKLNTVRVTYPAIGFLPSWMQAEIDKIILNEGDWEPVLNRSAHRTKIMSPDAVEFLRSIAAARPDDKVLVDSIDEYLSDVSTGPTRSLVGDPAWIGNLRASTVLKALASVSDDLLEALKGIRNQLARFAGLNATYVYIGLALNVIMTAVCVFFVVKSGSLDVAEMAAKVDALAKYFNVGG